MENMKQVGNLVLPQVDPNASTLLDAGLDKYEKYELFAEAVAGENIFREQHFEKIVRGARQVWR